MADTEKKAEDVSQDEKDAEQGKDAGPVPDDAPDKKDPTPSPKRSRSVSRSPSPRRARSHSPSHSRSVSRSRSRSRRSSRSRSYSPRSRSRSRSRSRRSSRSRSISRDRRSDSPRRRGGRSSRRSRSPGRRRGPEKPDVRQYRSPERWLKNLFEDALLDTLETTRLPCNVSKINDNMRKLDRKYHIRESGFPTFSAMCYWFDEVMGLLEVGREKDSVLIMSSKLERDVTKRIRSPPPRSRGSRRRGRSPRGRRGRSPPRGSRRRLTRSRSASPGRRRRDRSDSRDRHGGRGNDDRWEMV